MPTAPRCTRLHFVSVLRTKPLPSLARLKYNIYFSNEVAYFEITKDSEYLKVDALRIVREGSELDWDNNWIVTFVYINVGGFSGSYEASFMTTDFEKFKQELKPLYNNLKGTASFKGLEHQLEILVRGDGIGHFTAECAACDSSGFGGNKLEFEIEFDQTQLPEIIHQVDAITKAFPIKGKFNIKNE